ncbi:hypothetical protein B0T21DRAFT_364227 [Apiosordaria backusii]|uniref:Uncharacterized protein n=1 Tax=Apiosordaria backusii TaxID=314023 RepID=A0AA40BML4_9PEZI|nr:hypothetical protein B0T21DRAFT_364227 [Apiosordaria backusii]
MQQVNKHCSLHSAAAALTSSLLFLLAPQPLHSSVSSAFFVVVGSLFDFVSCRVSIQWLNRIGKCCQQKQGTIFGIEYTSLPFEPCFPSPS